MSQVSIFSIFTAKRNEMKINWKRFIWVLFVCLYSALFFFNCLKPFGNWILPYIYTMVLIIWLAYEYYKGNLFFQSGMIPDTLYFWLPRALFALFFYSAFVMGISTIIWWQGNQIGFYPVINTIGLLVLAASIYLRYRIFASESVDQNKIRSFYLSIILLIFSLALGYGSLFLIAYAIVIGLPLTYWNYQYEVMRMAGFSDYLQKQGATPNQTDLAKYWDKYTASKTKRPKQKQ